jgi:hypothetical protein
MPGLKPRPTSETTAKITATTNAKYRDLSTAAAKAPPSVEMSFCGGGYRKTTPAKATAYAGDDDSRAMTELF